jgi:hypothetical protein
MREAMNGQVFAHGNTDIPALQRSGDRSLAASVVEAA